jgi:DNA invertase Pin-like site-specific DNA recombinase
MTTTAARAGILIGYARCSTDEQDLTAQRGILLDLGVTGARGKLCGKPPTLSTPQQAHLVQLHGAGEHSIADLAEMFSVSRATVYRTLARGQAGRHTKQSRK